MSEYRVSFFVDPLTGKRPVDDYLASISAKDRGKILKYVVFLRNSNGVLDEPYIKHIEDKIRELRVQFGKSRHRIFYFTFIGKNIVFLHAFLKKTDKTPQSEIERAKINYYKVINNIQAYEIKNYS